MSIQNKEEKKNSRARAITYVVSAAAIFSCTLFYAGTSPKEAAQRPNIIYIMADDMGYSDIGCYGGEVQTPHIDQLAANGIKLRNFYNNARCCPTRASLLTGQYPHTVGMGLMVTKANASVAPGHYQGYLNNSFPTIAETLQQAGYRTYMSGKWHVGEKEDYWPLKRGFQRYFGLISGASSYYEIIPQEKDVRRVVMDDTDFPIPDTGFYMTDAFTDHAVQFVNEHKQQHSNDPFFLYLAYTAPHFPLHAYEAEIAKYEKLYAEGWDTVRAKRYERMQESQLVNERYLLTARPNTITEWANVTDKKTWVRKMAVYAAMIDRMDQNIGRLISTLKKNGQYENTLILFISDNGGSSENVDRRNFNDPSKKIGEKGSYVSYDMPWANVSNTPFRKYKKFLHEGGIISPCIIQWPAQIKPREGYIDEPAYITDLLPTGLELAGIVPKNLPGKSLSWCWTGVKPAPRTYYWEHAGNRAIRKGNWKLVRDLEDADWELYDLSKDPVEINDLAAANPERVQEMIKEYQAWAIKNGVKEVKPQNNEVN